MDMFDSKYNSSIIDKFAYEKEYLSLGYKYICGIDEVGRGCLFGPVTVAAVIMPLELNNDIEVVRENIVEEVDDSKKISAKKREELYLIDAVKLDIDIKQCSITKGDFKSYSIGCASIVAKVERDRMMNELPEVYQKYKVAKNKGYGTKEHMKAIEMYGASDMHRYSFEPIKSNFSNKKEEDNLIL